MTHKSSVSLHKNLEMAVRMARSTDDQRSSNVGSKIEKDKMAVNLVVSSQDGNKKIENTRRNIED